LKDILTNTNESQMVSHSSSEVHYCLWLQNPLNHRSGERRTSYIATVIRRILQFLHIEAIWLLTLEPLLLYFLYIFVACVVVVG
jgi:hypothetical protein